MANTVIQIFKRFLWYSMADSTIEDVKSSVLNDETFLRDVKNSRNATIHLQKKHFPLVVKKVVNETLENQKYVVTSIEYRFHGIDVFVSQK